ncbi:MAG: relaxase/mobilization nuclease domain-containing protein [Ruminococcus sp.]|nr:relaxase/mobilization nuclease domain-containing protein [Ruminococcus sp.]
MVIFKIVRHSNGGHQYMENMLSYILDDRRLDIGFNGISCYGTNQEIVHKAMEEMLFVKKYFGKVSGNPLIQFVVSYDSNVSNVIIASSITKEIARFLADSYQYIWVVHYKPREEESGFYACYHAHIVINSVSYTNGKMYSESPENIRSFAQYIANVTGANVKIECSYEKSDGSMSTYHDNKCIYPASHIYSGLL